MKFRILDVGNVRLLELTLRYCQVPTVDNLKYAPIISVDVKRFFNRHKKVYITFETQSIAFHLHTLIRTI